MRQFYVNRDSLGFMKTAYSTYSGSRVLTDYWNKDTNRTKAEVTQKKQPTRLEDHVSPIQVTTP